jgi:glycosyltransferase involved in cell wall biosynthesis
MRLLMVSGDRLLAAGREGPFWHLLREFHTHFERIDAIVPRPDGPVVQTELFDGRVALHPADCGRAGMLGYVTRKGTELVRAHGHALITIHDYGWFYHGLGAARVSRATGVPYLSEIHHVPGVPVAANARERFDRFVARRYVRGARGRAKAFRVVNGGEMPELLRAWGVPAGQIVVLGSLYLDLATFRPPASAVAAEQDVVFVGRMVANKGLERIVDALDLLSRSGKGASGLLVGGGPLRPGLEARVGRRGLGARVRFHGWVGAPAELADVYRKSRVVVCASTCEGGPRFTVEAMACGTPCVSTNVGIMPELLGDGAAGRLVGWRTEELARGIADVLADERRRRAMGVAARGLAERFEQRAMIRAYADGLKELAVA